MLRLIALFCALLIAAPATAQPYVSTLGGNGLTPQFPTVEGTTGWTAAMGSVCNTGMDHSWKTASGAHHRFEIRNTTKDRGCFGDPSTKRRSELHRKAKVPYGTILWGAFSFRDSWSDTAGMNAKAKTGTIIQMHSPSGSPDFAIRRTREGKLRITTLDSSGNNVVRYTSSAVPAYNTVHDVVYRFKIGSSGLLDVWFDGVQVLSYTGQVGPSKSGSYFCFGPYFASGISGTIIQEFGNLTYPTASAQTARISAPPSW